MSTNNAYLKSDIEGKQNIDPYFDTFESQQLRAATFNVDVNISVAQLVSYLDKSAGLKPKNPSAFQDFLNTYLPQIKASAGAGIDENGNYVENFRIEAESGNAGIQYDSNGVAYKLLNVSVSTEQGMVTVPMEFNLVGVEVGTGFNTEGQQINSLNTFFGNEVTKVGISDINKDSSVLNQDEKVTKVYAKLGDPNDGLGIGVSAAFEFDIYEHSQTNSFYYTVAEGLWFDYISNNGGIQDAADAINLTKDDYIELMENYVVYNNVTANSASQVINAYLQNLVANSQNFDAETFNQSTNTQNLVFGNIHEYNEFVHAMISGNNVGYEILGTEGSFATYAIRDHKFLVKVANDLGISITELTSYIGNDYVGQREVELPNGYNAYFFRNGDQLNITPPDSDSNYLLEFTFGNTEQDNPSDVPTQDYWGDLLVDMTNSPQTVTQALQDVPLTDYVAKLATVTDGGNDELYYGYGNGMNLEEAFDEMDVYYDPQDIVNLLDPDSKPNGGYIKNGASGTSEGQSYSLNEVADSITSAGQALGLFISAQADVFMESTIKNNGFELAFIDFANAFSDDLAAGTLDFDQALEEFAKLAASRFLQQEITDELTTDEAKAVIKEVLTEGLGMDGDSANRFNEVVASSISQMIATFAIQSQGWDGEQYAKAAAAVAANAAVTYVVKEYLKLDGDTVDAGLNVGSQIITSLINSGEISDEQWEDIGLQVGATAISAVFGLPAPDLSLFDGNALEIAVNVTINSISNLIGLAANAFLPGSGPFVAAATKVLLSAVQGSVYQGKVYYEGEYGDLNALLNSVYTVQQIDDGNGNMVDALVATNAQGSTIIAQQGITHLIGADGGDIMVGDGGGIEADDVMTGGDGSDYIEGKLGNDALMGNTGNDHISGGDGDDVIQGDVGNDIMFGDDALMVIMIIKLGSLDAANDNYPLPEKNTKNVYLRNM